MTAIVAKKLGSKPFIYTLYKWFSSATHGNVLYLERLVKPTRHGGRPRLQPESHPIAIIAGAAVLVAGTIDEAARVLPFSDSMKEERQVLRARFDDYLQRYQAT